MKLIRSAQAGSDSKGDVLVSVSPAEALTVRLTAKPIITRQFGVRIEQVVREAAREEQIEGALIEVKDGGGALDFAIRARVRCALRRGKREAAL